MKKVNKILAELVIAEATALRKLTTDREKQNLSLDLDKLNPNDTEMCIYGQMTGFCYSRRANELILKCATRVYEISAGVWFNCLSESVLNGKPKEVPDRRVAYFSPIEKYIFITKSEKGKQALLEYIKGVRTTLKVKDLYTGK